MTDTATPRRLNADETRRIAGGVNLTDKPDVFLSNNGDDLVRGGGGNDVIVTGAGSDTIDGGTGDDVLRGLDGNDLLLGGDGNDTIEGGAGDDVMAGGMGNDIAKGGAGADIYDFAPGTGHDTFHGGDGNDTIRLSPLLPDGITMTMNAGTAQPREGGGWTLTPDAAGNVSGVLTLADGSTLAFDRVEKIVFGEDTRAKGALVTESGTLNPLPPQDGTTSTGVLAAGSGTSSSLNVSPSLGGTTSTGQGSDSSSVTNIIGSGTAT